jgi:hypothetical protein
MIGGTGMQGDYQYNITYKNSTTGTRSNPDLSNTVDVEDINRTGVTLDAIPLSTDSQVDKIEIWRTLGNGTRLFKCKEIANTEWGVGEGDQKTTDNVADYIGMFKGAASKLDDEELPIDNLKPEDTYEDVAGPHVNRMWWSRDTAVDPDNSLPAKAGRLYYSPKGRFEAVDGFIDVSGNDDAIQKIVVWDERLWAFTTSHVYEIKHDDEPFLPVAVVIGLMTAFASFPAIAERATFSVTATPSHPSGGIRPPTALLSPSPATMLPTAGVNTI